MSTLATKPPTLNSSSSASSVSSLKSQIRTPTGTLLRRSSGSSTSIVATITPDPATLTSWASVFENYPPPQVRVVAFQVRNDAQAMREQLRSLVGESYRELLGTADTIIDMSDTVEEMEERFRTLATSCSSKMVRTRADKRDALSRVFRDRGMSTKMSVAIVKSMNDICFAIETLLGSPSLILTVSKLLLVLKELSASTKPVAISQIGFIGARVRTLEARYFRCIAAILRSTVSSNILDALVSYSLFTFSSPSATLSYFLEARSNQLDSYISQTTPDALLAALGALDFTITSMKSLFPNQFYRALARATFLPALNDTEFRKLPYIDFAVLSDWFPKDILEFTPPAAQDPADSPVDVVQSLTVFQASAVASFEAGVRAVMTDIASHSTTNTTEKQIKDLLGLRRTIFENLIERPAVRALLLSKDVTWEAEWLPTLKSLCNTYLNATATIAEALSDAVCNADAVVRKSKSDPVSLWDDAWMTFDISRGALDFRSAVSAIIGGNATDCGDILRSLKAWWDGINTVRKLVGRVKGVYEYDSFAGEEEPWMKHFKEAADREGQQLTQFVEDVVVPGGIGLLVSKIRALLRESSYDKDKVGILVRVARRVGELPLTHNGVRDIVASMIEDAYSTFAEAMFPVTVGLDQLKAYFSGNVDTGLWEEDATGGKYPFDASSWLAESIYDSSVRPIVGSASEDIVLGAPLGVSVCRRVVGQKWVSGISDGIARYLELIAPVNAEAFEAKDTQVGNDGSAADKELERTVSPDEKGNTNHERNSDDDDPPAQTVANLNQAEKTDESKDEIATVRAESNGESAESAADNSEPTDPADGEEAASSIAAPRPTQVHWVQLLFDVMYLGKVFSMDVSALREVVLGSIEGVDENLLETITKRVESCWKRTYLLYAIM
ncbi:hypothetical protein POJ06DRAFT_209162 [Lipomyces tetrasporus]|uniref:Conserved oligomeric Golgi complex subunit 1 n=1 Tax=Lipomyces tetrasporus TaxID=54092 RepID=A0AAD7VU62_9ASCO|nr:uncharacterized protein POJ06DRAFT_209162 [Lipomyces tetrasporus]KAJ8101469.1 hypothetical protein POJ06DRAFT_209162 [Lipomyces tetrasporus]